MYSFSKIQNSDIAKEDAENELNISIHYADLSFFPHEVVFLRHPEIQLLVQRPHP